MLLPITTKYRCPSLFVNSIFYIKVDICNPQCYILIRVTIVNFLIYMKNLRRNCFGTEENMDDKTIGLSNSEWHIMENLWESSPKTATQLIKAMEEETGQCMELTATNRSRA